MKSRLLVVAALSLVPVLAMAESNVGTMVFLHPSPVNHFGSVSQVNIGPNSMGLESFYFNNEKVRIMLLSQRKNERRAGEKYLDISVYANNHTVAHFKQWIPVPTNQLISLGNGYRFGVVVNHNPPGNMAHPTGKSAS